jgi:hypothetical protein
MKRQTRWRAPASPTCRTGTWSVYWPGRERRRWARSGRYAENPTGAQPTAHVDLLVILFSRLRTRFHALSHTHTTRTHTHTHTQTLLHDTHLLPLHPPRGR